MANYYSRRVDVVNRGYSGYNSRWILHLLPELFPRGRSPQEYPLLVTVFLGANDAALRGQSAGDKHVPLDEYSKNIMAIVEHIQVWSRIYEGPRLVTLREEREAWWLSVVLFAGR